MDEVITSKFSSFFYVRLIGIGMAFLAIIIMFGGIGITATRQQPGDILFIITGCLALAGLYSYKLIHDWKVITVTPDMLIVDYVISQRQLAVTFDEIVSANTYRLKNYRDNFIYSQSFHIEYKSGKVISINASDYNNYDELKAAIYKYIYGFGL